MSRIFLIAILITFVFSVSCFAQQSVVIVKTPDFESIKELGKTDVYIVNAEKEWAEVVADKAQLAELSSKGFSYTVKNKNISDQIQSFTDDNAGRYHTNLEVKGELYAYQKKYPEIVKVEIIGKTWENRPIIAVKISDNVQVDEQEASTLIMGLHHSREWISTEVPMALIDTLIKGYETGDERLTNLINNREIWCIPVVSPDGLEYSQKNYKMWRKNRRDNGDGKFGVDPNRNYGHHWGEAGASSNTGSDTYRGPSAFSEPCTQAVRDFATKHKFTSSVSFHSYSQLILWPYSYAYNVPNPLTPLFKDLAENMAKFTKYKAQNSADLYPASGECDDFLYGDLGILAFTFELGRSFVPSESLVDGICEKNVKALLYLIERSGNIFPVISHEKIPSTNNYAGPHSATVKIDTEHNSAFENCIVEIFYKKGNDSEKKLKLSGNSGSYLGDIPGDAEYGTVYTYHIIATSKSGDTARFPEQGELKFKIEKSLRLIVSDNGGKYLEYYTEAFDKLGWGFTVIDTSTKGIPSASTLKNYTDIVWFTGDDSSNTLGPAERTAIEGYIASGGNIIISGQDIGYNIKNESFYKNILGAKYKDDKSGSSVIDGLEQFAGLKFNISGGAGNQKYPDDITNAGNGKLVMKYGNDKGAATYVKTDKSNLLYIGFGMEGISSVENRAKLLETFLGESKLSIEQKALILADYDGSNMIFRKRLLRDSVAEELNAKNVDKVINALKNVDANKNLVRFFEEVSKVKNFNK